MRIWLLAVPALVAGVSLATACGESDAGSSSGGTSSSSSSGGSSGGSSSGASGGSSSGGVTDGGAGDGSCAFAAANLNGPKPCGAQDFGLPAAAFGMTDASAGETYDGGALQAGIYDAVKAERSSGRMGSWRETFVVDGAGKFTRIRQIDTGAGGGAGPVSYRSGTYTVNGGQITFNYACAVTDDAGVDAGPDTLPFDTQSDACGTQSYRYGATGIRLTLQRRK